MIPGADIPLVRELVLVGGGHAHALVLRSWAMKPVPGARLTLINPAPTAPYSGMLPGHVAGHYRREELQIDLVRLARYAGARLIVGAADGLDLAARRVLVGGRPPVAYDIVSLDIGVTSEMPAIPGFAEHAIPAKPLDRFADAWDGFCADPPRDPKVVVIGAGVAGVELALAAHHRLTRAGQRPQVTLVERDTALMALPARARRRLIAALSRSEVSLLEGTGVARIDPGEVVLSDGRGLPADFTIGAGGARPHDWLADTGLAVEGGYVCVDAELRSLNDPSVYAAGDCAHLAHAPRPKAGVFAVRAAPVLAHNLRADLTGGRRKAFAPQRDYLKLVSLGTRAALAEKAGLVVAAPWVWRWKNRIDQRFMERFRGLEPMAPGRAPAGAARGVTDAMEGGPLCGGCGAKLGRDALAGILAGLRQPTRTDILTRAGDDAAVLDIGGRRQVLTTDHLRAFTADPVLLARVAAVHAMGDIWAMGAAPQAAMASVTLPRMSTPMQAAWLEEIMAAAASVFAAEGAEIVGGHSAMGAELTIGFSVTGLAGNAPVTQTGARPGDRLILSRPLGTGLILAGEMALAADGRDVARAWAQMSRPQGSAAARLAPHAHAMTDVTGFGLAGHLITICEASGTGARIAVDALPALPGALELAASGIRASLDAANRAHLRGRMSAAETARETLLFDPQTTGGFLAAVAPEVAGALLSDLAALGEPAAVIGEVTEGPPRITLA